MRVMARYRNTSFYFKLLVAISLVSGLGMFGHWLTGIPYHDHLKEGFVQYRHGEIHPIHRPKFFFHGTYGVVKTESTPVNVKANDAKVPIKARHRNILKRRDKRIAVSSYQVGSTKTSENPVAYGEQNIEGSHLERYGKATNTVSMKVGSPLTNLIPRVSKRRRITRRRRSLSRDSLREDNDLNWNIAVNVSRGNSLEAVPNLHSGNSSRYMNTFVQVGSNDKKEYLHANDAVSQFITRLFNLQDSPSANENDETSKLNFSNFNDLTKTRIAVVTTPSEFQNNDGLEQIQEGELVDLNMTKVENQIQQISGYQGGNMSDDLEFTSKARNRSGRIFGWFPRRPVVPIVEIEEITESPENDTTLFRSSNIPINKLTQNVSNQLNQSSEPMHIEKCDNCDQTLESCQDGCDLESEITKIEPNSENDRNIPTYPNELDGLIDCIDDCGFETPLHIITCIDCDTQSNVRDLQCECNTGNLEYKVEKNAFTANGSQNIASDQDIQQTEVGKCNCSDPSFLNTDHQGDLTSNDTSNLITSNKSVDRIDVLAEFCFQQLLASQNVEVWNEQTSIEASGHLPLILKKLHSETFPDAIPEKRRSFRLLGDILNGMGSGFFSRSVDGGRLKTLVKDEDLKDSRTGRILDFSGFLDFFGSGNSGRTAGEKPGEILLDDRQESLDLQGEIFNCSAFFSNITQNDRITKPNLLDMLISSRIRNGTEGEDSVHSSISEPKEEISSLSETIDLSEVTFSADLELENSTESTLTENQSSVHEIFSTDAVFFQESVTSMPAEIMNNKLGNESENISDVKRARMILGNSFGSGFGILRRLSDVPCETPTNPLATEFGSGDPLKVERRAEPCKLLNDQRMFLGSLFGSGGQEFVENPRRRQNPCNSKTRSTVGAVFGSGEIFQRRISGDGIDTSGRMFLGSIFGSGDGINIDQSRLSDLRLFGSGESRISDLEEYPCNENSEETYQMSDLQLKVLNPFGSGESLIPNVVEIKFTDSNEPSSTSTNERRAESATVKVQTRSARLVEDPEDCNELNCSSFQITEIQKPNFLTEDTKSRINITMNFFNESKAIEESSFDCNDESCDWDLEKDEINEMSTSTVSVVSRPCSYSGQCSNDLNERCVKTAVGSMCGCGRSYVRHPVTRKCETKLVVEASLRFPREAYDVAFADKSSKKFLKKKAAAQSTIKLLLEDDPKAFNSVAAVEVSGFSPGSLIIHWDLIVATPGNESATRLANRLDLAFTRVLRHYDVLQKIPLNTANVSLLYVALAINPCKNSDLNYCSVHANCNRDSRRNGGFFCSCWDGYQDLSDHKESHPGEICQAICSMDYCGDHGVCQIDVEGSRECLCISWYFGDRCQVSGVLIISCCVAVNIVFITLIICCVCCIRRRRHPTQYGEAGGRFLWGLPADASVSRIYDAERLPVAKKFRKLALSPIILQNPHPPQIIVVPPSFSECSYSADSSFNTTPSGSQDMALRT